jgi:hypothetical protein
MAMWIEAGTVPLSRSGVEPSWQKLLGRGIGESASLGSKNVVKMDVSTTRDQSVDTQQGGGFCPTSPFSGVGSRDSLEVFVFLPLQ